MLGNLPRGADQVQKISCSPSLLGLPRNQERSSAPTFGSEAGLRSPTHAHIVFVGLRCSHEPLAGRLRRAPGPYFFPLPAAADILLLRKQGPKAMNNMILFSRVAGSRDYFLKESSPKSHNTCGL